jgi:rubrerythrin
MKFNEVINRLIDQPLLHARFVNTLSMLEYVGARKILKSQRAEDISMQILGHAAEEMRHSQILKGLALQLSDGRLNSYAENHLLCGTEAKNYFQTVDYACAGALRSGDVNKNYLLTTLLIEERAFDIYPDYEIILRDRHIPNALGSIVRDEGKHLAEMRELLSLKTVISGDALDRLRAIEMKQFDDLMNCIGVLLNS